MYTQHHVKPISSIPESKKEYPIAQYHGEIMKTISEHQCVIIEAETGAGKSTQVAQMLLMGNCYGAPYYEAEKELERSDFDLYDDIIVTCPTRIAANTLANRVSLELETTIGSICGYESGYEKVVTPNTKIRYTTEGFENLREIHTNREKMKEKRVLIIDDFGKFGIDVETLIAWVKSLKDNLQEDFLTKVILMAAPNSFDAKQVSKFLNAPIISIPGMMYPITEEIRTPKEFCSIIAQEASEGKNILAFVPGKGEITATINTLKNMKVDAELIPLHGDLTFDNQEQALAHYSRPKVIIATNVAQSSITIDDIDVVVDSGLERHLSMIGGAYALDIGNISKADQIQRKGRAGRTKPGKYYWCGMKPVDKLEDFPTPAIVTGQLERIVLQLASVDVDAQKVEFLHQPNQSKIDSSKKTLRVLGAFDENNQITDLGTQMARIPLGVRYARMVVEAQKRGVADDVITISAIQEVGGIKDTKTNYSKFIKGFAPDLIGDLAAFNYAKEQNNHFRTPFGIILKNYERALELRTKIYDAVSYLYGSVNTSNQGNTREIELSCMTGLLEFLYERCDGGDWYSCPDDPYRRKLNVTSAALPSKYMLGIPKSISLSYREDGAVRIIYLLSAAMPVQNINTLMEIAPNLVKEWDANVFDYQSNSYYRVHKKTFNSVVISEEDVKISDNKEKFKILVDWFVQNSLMVESSLQEDEEEEENKAYPEELYKVFASVEASKEKEDLKKYYENLLKKAFGQGIPNLTKKKNLNILLANLI